MSTAKHQKGIFRKSLIPLCGLAIVCCVTASTHAKKGGGKPSEGPEYAVIDLGQNGASRAEALNNLGGVIATKNNNDSDLWRLDPTGNVVGIFPIPGLASDLNDDFEIVGHANQPDGTGGSIREATLWRLESGNTIQSIPLPTNVPIAPGNRLETFASGISSSGLVVGRAREEDSFNTEVNRHAVVWQLDAFDQVTSVTLPDGIEAIDVNSHGVVTGKTDHGPAVWKLDFDTAGQITGASAPIALPGIGGAADEVEEITDGGRVGGNIVTSAGHDHAVVWTVDTSGQPIGSTDFGMPEGVTGVGISGVNDFGQAVANSFTFSTRGGPGATIFDFKLDPWYAENEALVDFNDLIVDKGGLKSLALALDINDLGWIVGQGRSRTGARAYLAIPTASNGLSAATVPEPRAAGLLLTAITCLILACPSRRASMRRRVLWPPFLRRRSEMRRDHAMNRQRYGLLKTSTLATLGGVLLAFTGSLVLLYLGSNHTERRDAHWPRDALRLVAADSADSDHFGRCLALDGERALIGAPLADGAKASCGAAYVFACDSGAQVAKLGSENMALFGEFGSSVALYGLTALVGKSGDNHMGKDAGAACLYRQNNDGDWVHLARLVAADAAAGDSFGISVALDDGIALVGSRGVNESGAVYVFEEANSGVWNQTTKLIPDEPSEKDKFGRPIVIHKDLAVVGASDDSSEGQFHGGAAYVFRRDARGQWAQISKLTAPNSINHEHFGASITLDGNRVAIGAPGHANCHGVVYLFEQDANGNWPMIAEVQPQDDISSSRFGYSVAMSDESIAVGAPLQKQGAGAVYLFQRCCDKGWQQIDRFTVPGRPYNQWFGASVSLSGNTLLVGAHYGLGRTPKSGAAYLFRVDSRSHRASRLQ